MKKQSLGRGLGAILSEIEDAYENDIKSNSTKVVVQDIKLDKIEPNPHQPRKIFDEKSLEELSKSIQKHGVIQPILLTSQDGKYTIIAGERRYRASKLLGLQSIQAIITEYNINKLRELALIENIQREDLNPIELAISYKMLIEEYELTQDELSSQIYKSRASIANTLRLLSLCDYVQEKLLESKITSGHAKILVTLDKTEQIKIVDTIIGQKLSVRQSEELIKTLKSKKSKTIKKERISIDKTKLKELSNKFKDLGFKSKILKNGVIINFDNEIELLKLTQLFKIQNI